MTKSELIRLKKAQDSYTAVLDEMTNLQLVVDEAQIRLATLVEKQVKFEHLVKAGREEIRKDFLVLDVDITDAGEFYLNNFDLNKIALLDVTSTTLVMGSLKLIKTTEKEFKLFKKYAAVLGCD